MICQRREAFVDPPLCVCIPNDYVQQKEYKDSREDAPSYQLSFLYKENLLVGE